MKKLIFLIALLIIGLVATAQVDTTKLSNYEKYLLAKEKSVIPDTIVKYDTVYVEQEKPEYDDLYYQAKKDELKVKSKELRLEKKKLRLEQSAAYYDAKQEVYEDLSYTAMIYRFHRPYSFSYYWYWDPFYDPWFLDSWYWGWSSPYYYGYYPYRYNYWYGYNNWYWDWNWRYWNYPRYYFHNDYYSYNNYYGSSYTNKNNINYGRRERPSNYTLTSTRTVQPVTLNKTIEVDRRTGNVINPQINNQQRSSANVITQPERKLIAQPNTRTITTQSQERRGTEQKNIIATQRPTYDQNRRSYTPSYNSPRMSTRPQYNNTTTNRTYNSNQERYNYTTPQTQNRSTTTTQSRSSYSTPSRQNTPSRSSTYSIPSRNSSSYSAPSRSSNSYSAPNRSSNSYSGGSSFSGGGRSSSGTSSGSSSSSNSSGRRR